VIKAALLGAERFGFGTAALIAIGCKMARQCHSNTCPVGIATQAEELRAKYFGTPEMLIGFFTQLAQEVREILAWLGHERLDDVIGRADLLRQADVEGGARWRGVDLSRLVIAPHGGPLRSVQTRNDRPDAPLDDRILEDMRGVIEEGGSFEGAYPIRNTDRTVGGRVSGRIAMTHGDRGLPKDAIRLRFTGSAGQSFGAWLVEGLRLEVVGEANDYVAKGMGGGEISIRQPDTAVASARDASLVGNTVLYGATGGALYVAGRAGERFAVRNSGAVAVVEGVGKHGCEYMTRGIVVVLGTTGRNFGAGMSGGCAFVLDRKGDFPARLNPALVAHEAVSDDRDIGLLRSLIERHHDRTGSVRAGEILRTWEASLPLFWRIAPKPAASGAAVRAARRHVEDGSRALSITTTPSATP
jgi:glutamate synthase (NADPH/NADH) large chain/glutamate synthase (ferredoxin)